ncbi:hypothetical protein [Flavobacterium sp. LB2R40]
MIIIIQKKYFTKKEASKASFTEQISFLSGDAILNHFCPFFG